MRYFWLDEGELPNILFTAAVTAGAYRLRGPADAPGAVRDRLVASLVVLIVAVAAVKRAVMNMVVHAYDLFFYLSSWSTLSYLWSDQRRYLVALAWPRCWPRRSWAGLPTAPTARACRAAGRRWPCSLFVAARLVRRRRQGRAAPHAVLLREPVRLVLLRVLGRDARGAVAGRAAGGAPPRRGRTGLRHSRPSAKRAPSRRTSS